MQSVSIVGFRNRRPGLHFWFSSTSAVVPISTAFVLLDFHGMGTRLGIGMMASEHTTLQIASNMRLNGTRFDKSSVPVKGNDSIAFWQSLKQGEYFCVPEIITNQPSSYGYIDVFKRGTDFKVIWYTQSRGSVYRKSGNASTQTGWIEIH